MLLQKQFADLVPHLLRDQSFWRPQPFNDRDPDWLTEYPRLASELLSLNDAQVSKMEACDDALYSWFSAYLPALSALLPLLELPLLKGQLGFEPNARQFAHIPGRKWTQIQAFCANTDRVDLPFLEWCAGKGHLGRLMAQRSDQPVLSLEYDESLCEQGVTLAQRAGTAQSFRCQDVMHAQVSDHFTAQQHAVALHACGDLHRRLLEQAVQHRLQAVTFSPCCYHLTQQQAYQPLSRLAGQYPLALSRADLRLAVQETATAPARVKRLRAIEVGYRLAMQAVYRAQCGCDDVPPLPSCAKKIFSEGFPTFADWATQQWGIPLPSAAALAEFEREGQGAWQRLRRMELVRQLYRRPLEIYLVLDRALYLQEQGYRVSIGCFTDRQTTPRNVLIKAERPD
ncbi:methyltransferase [Ferrimonas pelagia]|uniref:Methyltransferase n=1 Tax=Ferrimonas pelagia TaxID=1177826 RepID=A0ABP9FIV8_9GAMM